MIKGIPILIIKNKHKIKNNNDKRNPIYNLHTKNTTHKKGNIK